MSMIVSAKDEDVDGDDDGGSPRETFFVIMSSPLAAEHNFPSESI
jgi:hypothetical protein